MALEDAIRDLHQQLQEIKAICEEQVKQATENRSRVFAELEGEHIKRRQDLEDDYRTAEMDYARRIERYRQEQAELTQTLDRLREEVQVFRTRLSAI